MATTTATETLTRAFARIAREHAPEGGYDRARHRRFVQCTCGTRHPVGGLAVSGYPTHDQHLDALRAEAAIRLLTG